MAAPNKEQADKEIRDLKRDAASAEREWQSIIDKRNELNKDIEPQNRHAGVNVGNIGTLTQTYNAEGELIDDGGIQRKLTAMRHKLNAADDKVARHNADILNKQAALTVEANAIGIKRRAIERRIVERTLAAGIQV